ncbi:unnamed protein product [Paramecium sonneborni]|uniref:Uncharacterized protein n=1 Tax=Paramecium sonneborni TaxID=65129 RepID=A0A8S1LUI4_9CILI|nr:unnamed protein product [Paramecium sonneborni]
MEDNQCLASLFADLLQIVKPQSVDAQQFKEVSNERLRKCILELVRELTTLVQNLKEQLEEFIDNKYEQEIQRLENTIRQHIRVEQQQRLQIEALMQKLEEEQQKYEAEVKNQNEKIKQLENACSQISINKVQNLNQTNFIIDPNKKSPTAYDRLNQLVSAKTKQYTQSATTINSQQLLKIYSNPQQLLKKMQDQKNNEQMQIRLDTQQSEKEQSLLKLRRCMEDNKSEMFSSQRVESSSLEKYNRNSKLMRSSTRQSQIVGNSFDLVSKTMQHYKKQQKSLGTLRQSWKK